MAFIASAIGVVIAYIDSRPGWDDTGVMAAAIALSCCLLAMASATSPWLIAIAVGAWLPLIEILTTGNWGSLLALVFAFGGAYLGAAFRRQPAIAA